MAAPVKLTVSEGVALAMELADAVGHDQLLTVLTATLGVQRALALAEDHTGRISKAETAALVKAVIPLVPGDTLKAKIKVAIAALRRAIPDRSRQDAILAYVVERIKDYKNPPPVAIAANDGFLRFYGRVNLWCAAGEDELRKDLQVCSQNGVGYQIEMAGWRSGETAFDGHLNLSRTMEMYRKLNGWCKTAGIPLFVSITNWNVTQTKYGNVGRPFASVVPVAKQLAQCVKDCGGREFVYVQPVAETGNDASATAFEKWCGDLFAGWKLVYNGGSRPSKPAYGWHHFAYHPNTVADGGKAGGISVSDTGTIIKQLAADGTLEGPGDPSKIAAWFAKCKAAGAIGAGYYAFKREKHDPDAIRACAANVGSNVGSNGDDIDLSAAIWHGPPNAAKAKVLIGTLTGLTINDKEIRYSIDKVTDSWEPHRGSKNTNQCACFFVKRNGRYVGGRFDDSTYSRKTRELKNIRGKYTGGIVPTTGEEVWFCFTDVNGTVRTNCQKVRWP